MPVTPALKPSAAAISALAASSHRTSRQNTSCILRLATVALLSGLLASAPGCYYGHLASGQLRLLLARESIGSVLADPSTSERLREQLELIQATRRFASELGLEVGGRYTSYVEWPGDRIVTTVVATRPREVEAAGFRFPIVGRVPYKGFFDIVAAEREAAALSADGLDVCIIPVPAYSTLGWMDDPVTSPMLRSSDARLVDTVIHELVHATAFAASQPTFNEGVALFVGQEGSIRFYASAGRSEEAARAQARVDDDRLVARTLLAFRNRVAAIYASNPTDGDAARSQAEAAVRRELAALPLTTRDASTLAQHARLNDACLAARGTYSEDAALHADILRLHGGDLRTFVRHLEKAADSEDPRAAFFGSDLAADDEGL